MEQVKDLSILEENSVWINPNEKVFWIGKPNRRAYIANEFWDLARGLLFIAGAIAFFFFIGIIYKKQVLWKETAFFFGVVLSLGIYRTWKQIKDLKSTAYALTDSRLIICKNTYSSVTILELHGIISKEIKRTFIDRKYGTGTLAFHSGVLDTSDNDPKKIYDYFHSIDDPEKVLYLISKVSTKKT